MSQKSLSRSWKYKKKPPKIGGNWADCLSTLVAAVGPDKIAVAERRRIEWPAEIDWRASLCPGVVPPHKRTRPLVIFIKSLQTSTASMTNETASYWSIAAFTSPASLSASNFVHYQLKSLKFRNQFAKFQRGNLFVSSKIRSLVWPGRWLAAIAAIVAVSCQGLQSSWNADCAGYFYLDVDTIGVEVVWGGYLHLKWPFRWKIRHNTGRSIKQRCQLSPIRIDWIIFFYRGQVTRYE